MTTTAPRGSAARSRRDPRAPIHHVDWTLVGAAAALAAVGAAAVYSATQRSLEVAGTSPTFYLERQLLFHAAGVTVACVVAAVDHRRVRDHVVVLYLLGVLSLVGVLFVGVEVKGARSWYQLPNFQLQPSELVKLVVIAAVAAFFAEVGPSAPLRGFVAALVIPGVPAALILLQPDLGTTLVIVAITMGTFLVGGARTRHIVVATLLAVLAITLTLRLGLLPEEQASRLTSFLNDEAPADTRYNYEQAEIAIGAGGVSGRGWLEGTQTNLDFVPEQHTDFIFTAVAEEFGFVGSAGVLALFGLLGWRLWRIAALATDAFATIAVLGLLTMLVFQIFQNIGMTIGLMPITGIPLPLLSHGGSSTVVVWAGLGFAAGVHSRRYQR